MNCYRSPCSTKKRPVSPPENQRVVTVFYTRKKTVTTRWFSGGETGRFFVEHGER